MAELRERDWAYSGEHREVVWVVDARRLWDQAIQQINLPALRNKRLGDLERQAAALRAGLAERERVAPELGAIVILRVEAVV